MTDVRKTLLDSMQRSSLLAKPGSNAPFALDVAGTSSKDAFQALERRKQEVFQRIRDREAEVQKVDAEAKRLLRLHDQATRREPFQTRTLIQDMLAQAPSPTEVQALEAKLLALKAEIEESKRELAQLQTLDQDDSLVRDIAITVGYIQFPAMSGPVPVYPIIICEFAHATGFKHDLLQRLELEIDETGRYKLYEPGNEDSPFAETDEPVDADANEGFQRLAKHWGYWFLRVQGGLNQWDFQIIGNKVYPLKHPIEASLSVIEGTRQDAVRMAVLGSRHDNLSAIAEAEKLCDRFEDLVGKLPVKRRGLQYGSGIVHARVVQKNLKDMNANAQWVKLDEDQLEAQLRKIMSGPFLSVVWEDVRTGVDLMQLMPKVEGNRGPDIWLRAKRGHRQPIGHVHKIQAFGQELPLEKFKSSNVETLREEDASCVRRFYQVTAERLRTAKAARIESSTDAPSNEIDKQTHTAIVQNYLRLCQVVRVAASANDANAQHVWPLLRDATIFELPPAAYLTLYEEFFRYCVRSAKVDPNIPLAEHSAKQRKRVLDVIGTGMDAPFPEKLPFKSCFFAYGAGVTDDPNSAILEKELRARESGDVPPSVGKLYGHLVTEQGIVVSFRYIEAMRGDQDGVVFTFDRDPSSVKGQKWDRPHSMTPWIINALVAYVNEHKTLVEAGKNGFGYQSLVKKTAKQLSMKPPIPPPFYTVLIRDEFIREQARVRSGTIKRHIDWQHRWRVRGHDCVRFMRGALPIDPELESELLSRQYKVYTTEMPDSETFMALAKRNVPPKSVTEWLAVKIYWRKDSIKGPENKLLVESVRRPTKEFSTGESS